MLVTGMWWILIGMFLQQAARDAYLQVRVRHVLSGQTVSDFVAPSATVPASASVAEFLETHALRHGPGLLPVLDDGRLLGSVTGSRLVKLPRDTWAAARVGAFVEACGPDTTIEPSAPAQQALGIMTRSGRPRLMVVAQGQLLGLISLRDLLDYCSAAMELSGTSAPSATAPGHHWRAAG
jgi:CBS domain-containing protein